MKTFPVLAVLLGITLLLTACAPALPSEPNEPAVASSEGQACSNVVEPVAIVSGDTVEVVVTKEGGRCFTFRGQAGDKVTIELNRLDETPDMDPYLELFDPNGKLEDFNDDAADGRNSLISEHELLLTGDYQIVARSYSVTTVGQARLSLFASTLQVAASAASANVTSSTAGIPSNFAESEINELIGRSNDNHAVWGITTGDNDAILGEAGGGGYGVYGVSEENVGVVGRSDKGGVWGDAQAGDGVLGQSIEGNGVYGRSENGAGVKGWSEKSYAGYFIGEHDTGYFSSEAGWRDIVLGGKDGMLTSEPADSSSSLIFTSNNNFIVNLDDDGYVGDNVNQDGQFIIRNQSSSDIFTVSERGKVTANDIVVKTRLTTNELEIIGGSDLSERFVVHGLNSGHVTPLAGMLVSIDPDHPGDLMLSTEAYDHRVAGVIAGAGGIQPGIIMAQNNLELENTFPVAMTGRVYCWANASNGPIEPGDLLTTSDTPGYVMKAADYQRAQGATIGKAMTSLSKETGLVLILVTLQ